MGQFGLTLKQLRELMEIRGGEAVEKIKSLGGADAICKQLRTSATEGEKNQNSLCNYCFRRDASLKTGKLTATLFSRHQRRQVRHRAAQRRVRLEHDPAAAAQDLPGARVGGPPGRDPHHPRACGHHLVSTLLLQAPESGRRREQ